MQADRSLSPDEAVALSNCDREPIHIPGRIQSFGAVIAISQTSDEVTHYSENFPKMFPELTVPAAGDTLRSVFPEANFRHAVRGALGLPTIREQREWLGLQTVGGVRTDAGVYETDGKYVIELQPIPAMADEQASSRSGVAALRGMLAGIDTGRGIQPLLQSATKVLRTLTGYDRVMGYRFLPNGDGEVASEECGQGIEPFLGLRYPASDIPKQVRQVMLRATTRMIHDTQDAHARMITVVPECPLDLSLCHLRGVSPIHVEYLQNMGVCATMNIALIHGGTLWGLFALHHYRPRRPTPNQMSVAEVYGQLVSLQLQQEIEREANARRTRIANIVDSVSTDLAGVADVLSLHGHAICEAADWDGLAIVQGDEIHTFGDTPDHETVASICVVSTGVSATYSSLPSIPTIASAGLGATAGAIVQKFGSASWLLFFRNEIRHELRWAGDPTKQLTYGPSGPRLEPRSSFAAYTESVAGQCREWTRIDESVAQTISGAFIGFALSEASAREQASSRVKKQQDLLIAELNHRVRNTLALVQSLARQGSVESESIEHYVAALEQRIGSLANAHNLVGASGQQWARVSDIVTTEIAPFRQLCPQVEVDGPPLALRADIAPVVSLMIHELASNALRHGALSGIGESLSVNWTNASVGATLCWRERFKESIRPPARQGFGLTLIERAAPHECGGRATVEFDERELRIELWLPDDVYAVLGQEEDRNQRVVAQGDPLPSVKGLGQVLVLEDNLVLAMELEKLVSRVSSEQVDSVGTVSEATEALQSKDYAAALMDINLGEETSFDAAQLAISRGVAVVFVTGYDSAFELPDNLREVPRITKPVSRIDLQSALAIALQIRASNQDKSDQDKSDHAG